MTLKETALILNKFRLAFPNMELTENTIKLWHELFQNEQPTKFNNAFLMAVKEPGRNFFPSPGEVQGHLLKMSHRSITMKSSEALTMLGMGDPLIEDACRFANRSNPENNVQYSSPEELAKANSIREACWKRDFKERFETVQSRVKSSVVAGMDLTQAIALATSRQITLPTEVKKLISKIA